MKLRWNAAERKAWKKKKRRPLCLTYISSTARVTGRDRERERERALDEDTGSSVQNKRPVQIIQEEEPGKKKTKKKNRRNGKIQRRKRTKSA